MMHMMNGQRNCVVRVLPRVLLLAAVGVFATSLVSAQTYSNAPASTNSGWMTQPISMVDALNLTLKQNSGLVKARADLESSRGLVIETRAVALPNLTANSRVVDTDPNAIQQFPFSGSGTNSGPKFVVPHYSWNANIQVVQNIYTGGRLMSALRAAKLQKEQSMFQYQSAVADALLATRVAYYDVLVAEQQITVNEASVALLTEELQDQQRRYEAGTVPRFNVLQAEVAPAKACTVGL